MYSKIHVLISKRTKKKKEKNDLSHFIQHSIHQVTFGTSTVFFKKIEVRLFRCRVRFLSTLF